MEELPGERFADGVKAIMQAFAEALRSLDQVSNQREASIATLINAVMAATIVLVGEANRLAAAGQETGGKSVESITGKIPAMAKDALASQEPAKATVTSEVGLGEASTGPLSQLELAVAKALGNAAENAVSSQHSDAVVGQAALTQALAAQMSVVTAAIGTAEKEALKEMAERIGKVVAAGS